MQSHPGKMKTQPNSRVVIFSARPWCAKASNSCMAIPAARSCPFMTRSLPTGPGATNLVTGLATAYMDSTPIVAITGQVARHFIGRDAFQETDVLGVTQPITKHNFLVQRVEDIADIVHEAFRIERGGRPGPVLIDIPKDVQLGKAMYRPSASVN